MNYAAARNFEPCTEPELPRFTITSLLDSSPASTLAADVLRGLTSTPKILPPKYFYDERGARLFDAICDTDEYYPTRTETALLERFAGDIVKRAGPRTLLELGSGAARKTRILLDHLVAAASRSKAPHLPPTYIPVDISETMLRTSAEALLRDYSRLHVHGVIADYDHHLHRLPGGDHRLIAFLGSTIGNFVQPAAVRFLGALARGMGRADRLLLGLDLVKAPAVLHAAYNDARGITAAFNRNVLHVINRELDACFDPADFEHIARYLPEQEHIEMSLRARRSHNVQIGQLGLDVGFAAGERLRTEISRKFTHSSAATLIRAAGLRLAAWYESDNRYFALALAALP